MAAARPRELLERLVAADVAFVLVGGFAVNAWGYLRGTEDVDIVPDPDRANLDRLTELLESLGGRVEVDQGHLSAGAIGIFLKAGDRTLITTELGPLDVLQGLPQVPPFSRLEPEARSVDLGGFSVLVCSLEALLEMKRGSDRSRDREDVQALNDTQRDSEP